MAYSLYDGYRPPDTPSIAGKARAKMAKRDKWGRFLPNDGELKPPVNHGVDAGKIRAKNALRDRKGRFIT